MKQDRAGSMVTASELRDAFDWTFASCVNTEVSSSVGVLAIRISGDAYALSVAQVSGLFKDRRITVLPTDVPALLGIAGLRGGIVPVYDLGVLLGYPSGEAPRWMVVATAHAPVGLAFDQFEGHVRIPETALAAAERTETVRAHVREIVRTPDGVRGRIDIPAVIEAITTGGRSG